MMRQAGATPGRGLLCPGEVRWAEQPARVRHWHFRSLLAEPALPWPSCSAERYPLLHFQANAQLYAGIAACVLGACGLLCVRNRNMRALLVLAVFAALLAAGNATPFFKLFFHIVPGLSAFEFTRVQRSS